MIYFRVVSIDSIIISLVRSFSTFRLMVIYRNILIGILRYDPIINNLSSCLFMCFYSDGISSSVIKRFRIILIWIVVLVFRIISSIGIEIIVKLNPVVVCRRVVRNTML